MIGFIDSVRASTLIGNCKITFECCELFPRNQEEVLKKYSIKNSLKSFINFSELDTNPIKINGCCITQEDVLDKLRDVKKEKQKTIKINKK